MKGWQRTTVVIMILGVLVFYSAHSNAASKDVYQNVFIEVLEMGPATYLKINAHGKTAADIDKKLTELYHANGLQPFWIKDEKPGPRGADILSVLEDAKSHGLVPADYFVDKIHRFWDSSDTAGLVRLDILLTLGMMRYVVSEEDYRTGLNVQNALATGAKEYSYFGRNEGGGQLFHRWIDAIISTDDSELPQLFEQGISGRNDSP